MTTASTDDNELIWYASYGSNLDRERFLAYLTGAQLQDSDRPHRGARDPREPREDRALELPHRLFFGGSSQRWGGGGVAFLDNARATGSGAHARAYLISVGQFEDVFAQENGQETKPIDLAVAGRDGRVEAGGRWYGLVLRCGEIDGRPVLTFTSPTPAADWQVTTPGSRYLRRLAAGLRVSHQMSDDEIVSYFQTCPGVVPEWGEARLHDEVLSHLG